MQDMHVAMLTTRGPDGLRSVPMARQEVEPGADLWFITARDTDHVPGHRRRAAGRAHVLRARRLGFSLTGRRRESSTTRPGCGSCGPRSPRPGCPAAQEDPNATLIRVAVDRGAVLGHPRAGRVASLISFAKTRLTGETYDAEHGTVEP